jgi:hypothetical protein
MKVRDVLDIQNKSMGNREKGLLLTKMLKARAKRYNPTDTEIPSGWNASPYQGGVEGRAGGQL